MHATEFDIDVTTTPGTAAIRPNGVGTTSATCVLTYKEAASGGVPTIGAVVTDCN
ncbi:hypothetical protein D3C75_1315770 [compost metagenome]